VNYDAVVSKLFYPPVAQMSDPRKRAAEVRSLVEERVRHSAQERALVDHAVRAAEKVR